MNLAKLSETATTVTLGWSPVPGCVGYRFSAEKQPKFSHTFDPARDNVKFSKGSAWYKVEALGVAEADTWPDTTPPPTGKPLVSNITAGGTYTGAFNGDVTVSTTQPVIVDGAVGDIRLRDGVGGVDVETRRCRITGRDAWDSPRWAVWDNGPKRVYIHHNDIRNTCGIYYGPNHTPNPSCVIACNRHVNIKGTTQGGSLGNVGNFVQFAAPWGGPMDGGTNPNPGILECSWNEIINEHNKSNPEDVFSLYKTSNARILNNLINGQTKPDSMSGSSQNSITVDPHQEAFLCYDNVIEGNFVIDAYAIGMFGGNSNQFLDNYIVSDGKMGDTGQAMRYGYEGIWVAAGFNGNVARGNNVGYIGAQGRVDGRLNNAGDWTNNTQLPNPITRQTELDHIAMWRQRAAAAEVTIGA